ncbi:hypothetical protein SAMN06264365_112224 [Actinoplanes regularis]|uniref:Uncharacterized protein n=1 Tax=Actinoplanes regularis TaxID=52697 RepID=A0A239D2C0_9ACTN|nr:hypothetical protein SAMN06264365_112224 [Actinoplanes regularis]
MTTLLPVVSSTCHSSTHRELLASEPTYRETVLA